MFLTGMLLLGSCGGGSSNAVLTGTFLNGAVEGLRFETASQSGLTGATGEYTYRAGETITFSIGGITLGSATGAAQLTPFDLYGLAPPSSEIAMRTELSTYNDITDFDRVANITMLLVFLDNDSDSTNGLDLTGWDNTLTSASLDFDANLFDFFYEQFDDFASQYNLSQPGEVIDPLLYLYDTLGITVAASLKWQETEDDGNNGGIDYRFTSTHDAMGRETGRQVDFDNDAILDRVSVYTYDLAGNRDSISDLNDTDDDGTVNISSNTTNTYNANNDLSIQLYERDDNNDSTVDYSYRYTYTYDANGNQSAISYERDSDGDGSNPFDYSTSNTYTYDNGNLSTNSFEEDIGSDTVIDYRDSYAYSYDTDGNPSAISYQRESTGSGVDYSTSTSFGYDFNGKLSSILFEKDDDNNGIMDFREIYTYAYDTNGNQSSILYERDGDANILIEYSTNTIFTYDINGNLSTLSFEEDVGNNGTIDYRDSYAYTYHANGNLLTSLYEEDFNGDSTLDYRESDTYTYDANGNLLTSLYEEFIAGDTQLSFSEKYTYSSYANGVPQTQLYELDNDGNGVFDSETLTAYSYTVIIDGLYYLLDYYWI